MAALETVINENAVEILVVVYIFICLYRNIRNSTDNVHTKCCCQSIYQVCHLLTVVFQQ